MLIPLLYGMSAPYSDEKYRYYKSRVHARNGKKWLKERQRRSYLDSRTFPGWMNKLNDFSYLHPQAENSRQPAATAETVKANFMNES